MLYDASHGSSNGHFINVVILDDQGVETMSYDVTGLGAVELMTAYVTADGRIMGVIQNNIGLTHKFNKNLHLVQLYGPPVGAP